MLTSGFVVLRSLASRVHQALFAGPAKPPVLSLIQRTDAAIEASMRLEEECVRLQEAELQQVYDLALHLSLSFDALNGMFLYNDSEGLFPLYLHDPATDTWSQAEGRFRRVMDTMHYVPGQTGPLVLLGEDGVLMVYRAGEDFSEFYPYHPDRIEPEWLRQEFAPHEVALWLEYAAEALAKRVREKEEEMEKRRGTFERLSRLLP